MTKTVTVQCDHALAYAPEWVHLLSIGWNNARDRRRFLLDEPEAVIAAFNAGGIDLPLDYEHQNDRPEAKLSGPVPAAGWVKELATRAAGIWGRVEWTERARAMIAAREYRFLSTVLLAEKTSLKVLRIKGASLVHNPALTLTALASEQAPEETDMTEPNPLLARLAALLKLDPAATEDDILAALETRLQAKPDPAEYVPAAKWEETSRRVATELAALKSERAAEKVQKAIAEGYILPVAKDWALELCRSDEASFDKFLASSIPAWAYLSEQVVPSGLPPVRGAGGGYGHSAEVELLSEQLGIAPERFV